MDFKAVGIHHTALMSVHFKRSYKFYTEVLGAVPISTPSTWTFDDESHRSLWFTWGSQQIHVQYGEPETDSARHVALEVDDIEAARKHFKSFNIEVSETMPIPGAERFYINDPDDNLLEIMQWDTDWPAADANPVPPPDFN